MEPEAGPSPQSLTAFIVRGRGGGKTYAAVQWLKEDPDRRVIITVDPDRAADIRSQYGLSASQVMSCDGGQLAPPPRLQGRPLGAIEFAIDDADEMLRRAFSFRVALVTAKGDCGHGPDHLNPRPEPVVLSGKFSGPIDHRAIFRATVNQTMAYEQRNNPTSECGACAKPSSASFAYCPHCGTGREVTGPGAGA